MLYSFQNTISLTCCCFDIVLLMRESPVPDLNFLGETEIEVGTDQLEVYGKVQDRTHANIYTKEPLDFAMRTHLTNE